MFKRHAVLQSILTAATIGLAVSIATAKELPQGTTIAGWVENGWIGEPPIKVKVKLDTGAKNSSINAPVYREFYKDGQQFVSFILTNNDGAEVTIEKPLARTARIRRAGVGMRERPVIMLKVCVAGVTSDVEFTLADRSEMNYPILIGRTFLADKILVDSGRTFLANDQCKPQ